MWKFWGGGGQLNIYNLGGNRGLVKDWSLSIKTNFNIESLKFLTWVRSRGVVRTCEKVNCFIYFYILLSPMYFCHLGSHLQNLAHSLLHAYQKLEATTRGTSKAFLLMASVYIIVCRLRTKLALPYLQRILRTSLVRHKLNYILLLILDKEIIVTVTNCPQKWNLTWHEGGVLFLNLPDKKLHELGTTTHS